MALYQKRPFSRSETGFYFCSSPHSGSSRCRENGIGIIHYHNKIDFILSSLLEMALYQKRPFSRSETGFYFCSSPHSGSSRCRENGIGIIHYHNKIDFIPSSLLEMATKKNLLQLCYRAFSFVALPNIRDWVSHTKKHFILEKHYKCLQ